MTTNQTSEIESPVRGRDGFEAMAFNPNNTGPTIQTGPAITQLEFEKNDFLIAKRIARRLGFTQTAYTSTSGLWGLFCLPDRANQRHGCIIKTRQFGLMFVADLEDMHMEDLQP